MGRPAGAFRKGTFAAGWATCFLFNIGWGLIFPLKNVFIHDQGIPLVLIGILGTVSSVAFSLGSIALGRLSDSPGRRRLLLTSSLVIGSLASLGYVLARAYSHFLTLVAVDMLMAGGYAVMVDTIVTSTLAEEGRGRGFGVYRISGSIGYALAASQLGPLTRALGIRVVFIGGAIALLLAALTALFMTEPRSDEGTSSRLGGHKHRNTLQLLIATGLLWLFISEIVAVTGESSAFPFMSIYLSEAMGATPGSIGFLATIRVLAEIPAMLGLGRLSDRYGRAPVLVLAFTSLTLSWLLAYWATDLRLMYLAFPLAGLSIARYTVGVSLVSDRIPYNQRGTILGLLSLSVGLGGFISPTVGGVIADNFGVRSVFFMAFAVDFLALLLLWVGIRMGRLAPQASAGPIASDLANGSITLSGASAADQAGNPLCTPDKGPVYPWRDNP